MILCGRTWFKHFWHPEEVLRWSMCVALIVFSSFVTATDSAAVSSKPNILFILTDDHRWDAMSSMGHPFIKTPNLDKIADEGILFGNAFVTTSLCSPSRASFLTGQYAHRHGVVTNHTQWDNRNVTFLELLKKEGYDTAFIGNLGSCFFRVNRSSCTAATI